MLIRNTAWNVSKYGVFSRPYFPAFWLNTERYEVSLRIQSKCGKIRTRKNSVFGHISRSWLQTGNCCFYTNFAVFKIEACGIFFRRYLHKNEALHIPTFYIKMNHFNIVFHLTWNKWQRFKSLRSSFSNGSPFGWLLFFSGPGSG